MDIFLMTLLPYYLFLILKYRYGLYMLQQNSYNTENRYLKWTFKNYKKSLFNIELLVFLTLIAVVYLKELYYSLIIIFVYIILTYIEIHKLSKEQKKKSFNVTARVKRLITTILILFIIMNFFILYFYNKDNTLYYYLCMFLFGYLSYYIVWLSNIINIPVEKLVYIYYYKKAQKN